MEFVVILRLKRSIFADQNYKFSAGLVLFEYGYYWCNYGSLCCHYLVLHGKDGEEGERDPAWRAVLVDPESHPAQHHNQYRRYEQTHCVVI